MKQDEDKCSRCGQILIGSINNRICVRCGSPEFPRGTEERVCEDIANRQRLGFGKYGTTVEANQLPLVEWLRRAYHETLDKAIYLRRAIEEIGKNQ